MKKNASFTTNSARPDWRPGSMPRRRVPTSNGAASQRAPAAARRSTPTTWAICSADLAACFGRARGRRPDPSAAGILSRACRSISSMRCAAFKPTSHSTGPCRATLVTARARKREPCRRIVRNAAAAAASPSPRDRCSFARPVHAVRAAASCPVTHAPPAMAAVGSCAPETIRVNIPPGADPGKRIRLRGKGEAGVARRAGRRSVHHAADSAPSAFHSIGSLT